MSETQRNPFTKRACDFLIAGAFILLAIFWVSLDTPNPATETETVKITPSPRHQHIHFQPSVPPSFHLSTPASFYRTIIDNNLFRPLGWTPPRPTEPYRLIGTILPRDANMPTQAILESIAGNKTYIVSTGEKLDASTKVVSIQGKAVTLSTNEEQRTLRLNTTVYLNPSPANRYAARRSPAPVRPPTVRYSEAHK